jgi:hypothetical protein
VSPVQADALQLDQQRLLLLQQKVMHGMTLHQETYIFTMMVIGLRLLQQMMVLQEILVQQEQQARPELMELPEQLATLVHKV